MEISLYQIYCIVRRNFRIIFWSGASLGFSVFIFCLTLQPWYSHEVLVRDLDLVDGSASKFAGMPTDALSLISGKTPTAQGNKTDALTFLDFSFKRNPLEAKRQHKAYLDQIEDVKGSTYLRLLVKGHNREVAQAYAEDLVGQLQEYFVAQAQDQSESTKQQVETIDFQLSEIAKNIETTDRAIANMGPMPVLLQQKAEYQRAKITLQKASNDLKIFLSKRDRKIFEVVESRPVSLRPTFPPYFILAFLAFLAGAAFSAFVYIEREIRRANESEEGASRDQLRKAA